MKSQEIRKRFLEFFEKRGHAIIPSAPLVPENDPTVLFNTAGMQPIVPYLLGQAHPEGKRLADAQKCVRTGDIDEIGDNTHATFFEMLGNWSLGDYFKKEAIEWSYEFLTSQEEGLGLNPNRLYVTVFEGDDNAPRDQEAADIWTAIFEKAGLDPEKRIYFLGVDSNWWSPGANGPCGPDSEMFYDVTGTHTEGLTKQEYLDADENQEVVEIWNDVFMEYNKKEGAVVGKLDVKNVDTGAGLERLAMVLQGKQSIFDTDLFEQSMVTIQEGATKSDLVAERIIADHIRTAVFLISDGVIPANTDQGYVLRRLLRRAVLKADALGLSEGVLSELISVIIDQYTDAYPVLVEKQELIISEILKEEEKFRKALIKGMKEFDKVSVKISDSVNKIEETVIISSTDADTNYLAGKQMFDLYQTHGFPLELIKEIALERGLSIDEEGFESEMKKHQDLSRTNSAAKFKGGLADHSEVTTALHTCTHLMLAGLRKYLGEHVHQAGSNITEERTRFDFTHGEKVERDILDKVEAYVNEALEKKCQVIIETMDKSAAKDSGVEGSFWEKYPDKVTVYKVVADDGTVYSQELCGGPHVESTGIITGVFKIKKEQSSSAGVRRIKAILQ